MLEKSAAKLILNIDDNPERLRANSLILREKGYQVIEFENVDGALGPALENKPAVILLGDSNPSEKIKTFLSPPSMPPAIFTIQILGERTNLLPDADVFLKEPFSPNELIAQVEILFRLSEAERKIAEQSRAEEDLRDSERRFRTLVETIGDVFWVLDPENKKLIYVTDAYRKIWGRDLQSVYDQYPIWIKGIHPEDSERINKSFFKNIHKGKFDEEYRVVRPDGSVRWVRDRGKPIGKSGLIAGTTTDITARKKAEDSTLELFNRIERQHRIFDTILSAITDFAYIFDREGRFVYVNQALLDLWGLKLEEAVGKNFFELPYPQELAARLHRQIQQVFETKKGLSDTTPYSSPTGFDGFYEYIFSPVFGVDGTVEAVAGSTRDITERKRIEEELRESRGRLQMAMKAAKIFSWEMNPATQKIEWSDNVEQVIGFSLPADFVSALSFVHPEEREIAAQLILQTVDGGKEYESEFCLINPDDGEIVWVRGQALMVRNTNDHQPRLVGITENITERKQAQTALIVAERKAAEEYHELLSRIVPLAQALGTARNLLTIYRQIVEFIRASMPCAGFFISSYDANMGRRIAAYGWGEGGEIDITTLPPMPISKNGGPNSQAILTGKTQVVNRYMELMKTRPHVILQENGIDPQASLVVPMIVMGRVTGTFEVQAYENGIFKPEHIIALEMVANLAAVAIENVRLLESEAYARQAAEMANHAKDEFIAVVSHELRSPLNAMLGWARILQNKKVQDVNIDQAVETIIRNARTQSKLIEDLLDTARISSGKLRLEMQPVKLLQIVEAVLDISKPAAEAKEITIKENFDSNMDFIRGDADRIQQIIGNLLSNAIKFTPKGGNIEVKIQSQETNALIVIKDSGTGISPEFLPHIFEQFSQSDPASTRRHGGLGLGLALARKLVEMHGGTISAESEGLGKGATFTVSLPLRSSQPFIDNVKSEKGKNMSNEGKLKNLWILIVDDEADARDMVSFMLQIHGGRVTTAKSAVEALEVLKNIGEFDVPPDVIISDIGMPNEDGYALIQKIRALPVSKGSKVPAIALTAFNRPEDKQNALDAGFQMHLGKPIEPESLVAAISEAAILKVL